MIRMISKLDIPVVYFNVKCKVEIYKGQLMCRLINQRFAKSIKLEIFFLEQIIVEISNNYYLWRYKSLSYGIYCKF